MKQLKLIILVLITVMALIDAYAKPIDAVRLQKIAADYLSENRSREHISAIAITIKYPGITAPISSYAGYMAFNDKINPINKDTLFHIGSITKSFITALVLQLEVDPHSHFSIEDDITKYLPQYKAYQGVTVRQLMNMTSGIPNYTQSEKFGQTFQANPQRKMKSEELISFVYKLPLLFKPGSQYHYSNTNYILLGMLIEKLTGHTVTEELNKRIILPLKLDHTYYVAHKLDDITRLRLVHGYSFFTESEGDHPADVMPLPDYSLSFAQASGGMIANTIDVFQWVQSLFTPGKVLSEQQLRKLKQYVSMVTGKAKHAPSKDDPSVFGLGIVSIYLPDTGEIAINYEGMTLSNRAYYLYVPSRNILISVTTNSAVENKQDHLPALALRIYLELISK